MHTSPESDSARLAKSRLTDACHSKDTSLRLAWALTMGAAILLAGLALALIDYWLMLPTWPRLLGAAGLTVLTTFGGLRLVRLWRRPARLKEAALDLEAERPELGCEVSTAAEYLSGERQAKQEYEPELAAALEARAGNDLSRQQVHYEKRILSPAAILGATVLGLLIAVALIPAAFTALLRVALPFTNARYTTVKVIPGDAEIPVGRDITITNLFSGRLPKDPQFHWRDSTHTQWQTAPLNRSTNGAYVHVLKELRSDLTYRVTGNDAASAEYTIQTYIPPEVKNLSVQVSHPAYTKLPPATQKSPNITAVRASTAQVRIEPSVELARAKLKFTGLPELALEPAGDGSWTGTFAINKDADYWIELADKKGHLGVNDKPYHIKALPDAPPKVEIAEPSKDTRASPTNKVPVKISVADDFGVGEIKLVFHKLGGTEQVVTAKRETEQNGEVTASAELDLSSQGLRDYELVAYHAEATDNNSLDGPGKGKSPVYFVEITNEQAASRPAQGQNQRVNLLVIQKQIIADTAALATDAPEEKFKDLAARQRDATEFAQTYEDTLTRTGAPEAAIQEMQSARQDMETARSSLENRKRAEAIPPEEGALAHLYQVLKQMPELENLPTTPPPQNQNASRSPRVNVVLEAIKQRKKEAQDNQEIEDALQEAQDLARSQAALNSAMRRAGEAEQQGQGQNAERGQSQSESNDAGKSQMQAQGQGRGQGQGQGEGQGQGQGQGLGEGQGQGQAQAQGQGRGKGQGQGQDQGQGQGQGQRPGQGNGKPGEKQDGSPGEPSKDAESQSPTELAQKETELSKEAMALAEKLERLAGKDTRLGHGAGGKAGRAAAKMTAAAKALRGGGGFGAAGEQGFQGELALRSLVAQLERLLKNQAEPSDFANEEFPKEYEGLISEYLKKLSHAE